MTTRPNLVASFSFAVAAMAFLPWQAQAQSNVTISGTIDAGIYRGFDKRTQVGPISRSNLTFKGSEELGNGVAATFKLATRFDPDTGGLEGSPASGKPFWHGESTVGLKGAFGHIRIGRAMEAVSANDWAFDPWENFDRIASPAWYFWHYNYAADPTGNSGNAEAFRLNNGIFYDSPAFGGVSVSVSGSPEKPSNAAAGTRRSYQGALKYNQGPAAATLSYGSNARGDDVVFLGAKYAFGDFTLMGAYDRSEIEGAVSDVAYARTVGATYQLGAWQFKGSYGRLNVSGTRVGFIGLGSQYTLSKRTNVYASFGNQRPRDAENLKAYGVGINHSF